MSEKLRTYLQTESAVQRYNAFQFFEHLQRDIGLSYVLAAITLKDGIPSCLGLEGHWLTSTDFLRHVHRALQRPEPQGVIGERRLRSTSLDSNANHRQHRLRKAIVDSLNRHGYHDPSQTFFVSTTIEFNSGYLFAILGLPKTLTDHVPTLRRTGVSPGERLFTPVSSSLINTATHEFLAWSVSDSLNGEPVGRRPPFEPHSLWRLSGKNFMKNIGSRVSPLMILGMHRLFESMNDVSTLYYEGAAATGGIILADKNNSRVDCQIKFKREIDLDHSRASRKLLELTSNELSLLSNSEHIYGLGKLKNYTKSEESAFSIRFLGHNHWRLAHVDRPLMDVQYGIPSIPKDDIDTNHIVSALRKAFVDCTKECTDNLAALIREASQAHHGTILLISSDAQKESLRLANQSTVVAPFKLTSDILRHLTRIDGAIVVSPEGICFAFAAILDGKSTKRGDSGRGARYNSAIRYVDGRKKPCLAVVVSEDGGIDFVTRSTQ